MEFDKSTQHESAAKSHLLNTRENLDGVSPSFCLAKWYQVTLHLHNGLNHSCHHPRTHKISKDEIARNPSALHNTFFKKTVRKEMLDGKRPKECAYCWAVEDLKTADFSDRIQKSADSWAHPLLEKTSSLPWDADVLPTYLEVSFSNLCNFKCAYCYPQTSSSIWNEIETFGNYSARPDTSLQLLRESGRAPIPEAENPYIEAFWKWFPELKNSLQVLRVTGGEPLMSKGTFKLLETLKEDPAPNLELMINSNLGVSERMVDKMIDELRELVVRKAVKQVGVFTSIDTWGPDAEYIRFGLNLELFQRNLKRLLTQLPEASLTFMCTFNLLSVPRFRDFLDYILQLKGEFQTAERPGRIFLDISMLKNPEFLSAQYLPAEFDPMLEECHQLMRSHHDDRRIGATFHFLEINKMTRLIAWIKSGRRTQFAPEFFDFCAEYDRRKDTNFAATFPSLAKYYEPNKEV